MLVGREEMRFDFGEARFRLPRDAKLLGWIFDQFLYGEVTGIQCGHWLYRAPTLEAATFFARQAVEELNHVRQFLRLYERLGVAPGKAHPVIRFMATGSMGTDFAEHVATEMAVGEGLVLMIFYALIDTIDDPEVVKILESATRQEERHVAFGERQTRAVIERDPGMADYLLGLNLFSIVAMKRLAGWIEKRLGAEHEVLRQAKPFLERMVEVLELRLQRMGLLRGKLSELSGGRRAWLVGRAWTRHFAARFKPRPRLLTQTYLSDPSVQRIEPRALPD
jgi:hypothetical protein